MLILTLINESGHRNLENCYSLISKDYPCD